ncbi:MAG: glycosyltransferase family 2 protein [Chloroflexota bacterium]
MKVTGFTFIRNAIKLDYPVVESIRSILPLCDDFVIAVGNSDDDTLGLIRSIDENKIKIVETVWDESPEMKKGGRILAVETDKAFREVPEDSDWAFYIQGDEVVHEKYHESILSSMKRWKDDDKVDGLLFNYLHFYGSYDYIGSSPRWYDHEIRIIKNNKKIYSYRDAQGFRKEDNKKLTVKRVDAFVYHYGWVKEPSVMMKKLINASSFYDGVKWLNTKDADEKFDYFGVDSLKHFTGTHPLVMQERIRRVNWTFDYDISFNRLSFRYKAKIFLKNYLGINSFYENYTLI